MCTLKTYRIIAFAIMALFILASIPLIIFATSNLTNGCPKFINCTYNVFDCEPYVNNTNYCYFSAVIGNESYCMTDCVQNSMSNQTTNICPPNGSVCDFDKYESEKYCVLKKGNCINLFYYMLLEEDVIGVIIIGVLFIMLTIIYIKEEMPHRQYQQILN